MSGEKILVIDDETEIRNLIRAYLSREGFQIITAGHGGDIEELIRQYDPKLVLLDLLLPGEDGFEICRKIRACSEVPVLFVSCKDEDADKVIGLGIGGDDYITKPFSPAELVARVKAHLRRFLKQEHVIIPKSQLHFIGLEIDLVGYSVKLNGEPISLSSKEFELLRLLAENPDRVFKNEQLFDMVWGMDAMGDMRTLLVHISNLRKKIEMNENNPKYIITIRGVGYKFNIHACIDV
jgi:DNA-binding response OmpR family regulator